MANTIKLKNSVTTTVTPSTLAQGEMGINIADKKIWVGNASSTPILFNQNLPLSNPSLTGYTETVYAISDGSSVDINPANGTIQTWTLGANRTPTATSFNSGQSVMLMIADGTSYSVTWSTIGVVWVNTVAPTLPSSGYGVIVLWKVGSTVYGISLGSVA